LPHFYYQVDALLELKELRLPSKSNELKIYFMTNVIDTKELSDDDALREYKHSSTERFPFLKDPLFLLRSPQLNESRH